MKIQCTHCGLSYYITKSNLEKKCHCENCGQDFIAKKRVIEPYETSTICSIFYLLGGIMLFVFVIALMILFASSQEKFNIIPGVIALSALFQGIILFAIASVIQGISETAYYTKKIYEETIN